MSTKRSKYPMTDGGWNIWNIQRRQEAQRLWMINQFMDAVENNSINSAVHKKWNKISFRKASFNSFNTIKNNKNSPLTLQEWYKEINHMDPTIPKTEFKKDLKLKGYNYNNLFRNVLEIKDPKTRNTMFRFHSRCLPLNYLHDKQCIMCNNSMSNDPYGHLFFNCIKTKEFIKIHKLKRFLFDSTGSNKNWSYKRFDNNNKLVNQITPIIPENKMKDHQVNTDYALDQFHKPFFEWNYKAINYDLNRSFWHKSARLEFIKKIKTFKLDNSKQPHLINTPNTINNITIIRNEIVKDYCIPKTILHKRVIIDKFI
ncbi:hypothetical protein ACTA71_008374 [Dictyostelium dimigraforme]